MEIDMDREIDAYIRKADDSGRDMLLSLHNLILKHYPQTNLKIAYRILMYKLQTGWVGLGYWKQGVTLYSEAISKIAEFRTKHPKFKTGKGCINFKLQDEIPLPDVLDVIRFAMEHTKLS